MSYQDDNENNEDKHKRNYQRKKRQRQSEDFLFGMKPPKIHIPDYSIVELIGVPKKKMQETESEYRIRFYKRASELIEDDLRFQVAMGYIPNDESLTNEEFKKVSSDGAGKIVDMVMKKWDDIPDEF